MPLIASLITCRGMAAASAAAQRWAGKLPQGDAHDGAAAESSETVSEQVSEIGSTRNTPRSNRMDEADAVRDVAAVAAADGTLARARRLLDRQGMHPPQSEVIRTQSEVIRTHSTASDACSGCHGAVSAASLHAPSVALLHLPQLQSEAIRGNQRQSEALLHLPQLHLSKQGSSVGGTSVSRACVSDCMSDCTSVSRACVSDCMSDCVWLHV